MPMHVRWLHRESLQAPKGPEDPYPYSYFSVWALVRSTSHSNSGKKRNKMRRAPRKYNKIEGLAGAPKSPILWKQVVFLT